MMTGDPELNNANNLSLGFQGNQGTLCKLIIQSESNLETIIMNREPWSMQIDTIHSESDLEIMETEPGNCQIT